MKIEIESANYLSDRHAKDIGFLLNYYATDPMGGGKPLPNEVRDNIAKKLSKIPHAFSVIAYADGIAAGLMNCFQLFSTFKCKPIVNIHDVIVLKEYRGHKISHRMLEKVEVIAKSKNCCKLSLEVLEGNKVAKSAYRSFGFSDYELNPSIGKALFWEKFL